MGRMTLRDVAERSGLSITTFSHVVNDVPGKRIPASTRDRVRAAVAELHCTPNRFAQGLRLQRSNTLGFVNDRIATSPHAGRTILGAQDAAAEYGSLLLMVNSGDDADLENREIRALLDRQVDGIVYAAEYQAAERGLRIPADLSVVGFDDQEIISAGLRPGLTTVALPHYEMGRWAVTTLLRGIDTEGKEPPRNEILPCPLVRRASVGPPPRS